MIDEDEGGGFGRKAAGILAAALVTLGILFAGAYFVDPSATRERLGLIPELDVPYVSSRPPTVQAMLDMADIGPDDYVIDLGTGDGRILLAAAVDRGASGLGVDLDPALVEEARSRAESLGVADRVKFREQDLFDTPLDQADVITMFLLPSVNMDLRPRLLELTPGTRIVSNRFDMGDWPADEERRVVGYPVYSWIVPADVAGRWLVKIGEGELTLNFEQDYQTVRGTALLNGENAPMTAELRGDRLSILVSTPDGEILLEGRVEGDAISFIGGADWTASRQR
ncbi:SAM-dependent methyltransferase [Aurantiacibacter sediminis]|uniref:Class I SAM-dependent methyltransferase n=1 Tax=Aurantiacibacter sediminis TaxID=2793064 RepID=A0ABS0N597_9SPHN|nr:methyltransferase domain-containing protein [Aurantiacibacter sediminis]MBH5322967.1 class I SAM-dependent methyltransferase [Aurantiacibacter sediminis]